MPVPVRESPARGRTNPPAFGPCHIPRMTGRTQRRDITERDGRAMRLLFLSGRSVADIARRLGRDAGVISRYMIRHDLKRPEAALERQALALDYAADLQIDALVAAQGTEEIQAAAAMIVRMAGEVRRMHEARMEGAWGENANASMEAARERREHLDRLLGNLVAGYETKGAGLEGGGCDGPAGPAATGGVFPLPADLPGGSGEPAGKLADMAVPGRTPRARRGPGRNGYAGRRSAAPGGSLWSGRRCTMCAR